MGDICLDLLLPFRVQIVLEQFKSEPALLDRRCQTADVPLFASRGVRLLQLKSGHLLHLLNLAPVSAVTPPPKRNPPSPFKLTKGRLYPSPATPFYPLQTPCSTITLPPLLSRLKSLCLPPSVGPAVITHPSRPQIKCQCIDQSYSGLHAYSI